MEAGTIVQLCLHEIFRGSGGDLERLDMLMQSGGLYPPQDVSVDARSVYDAVNAQDPGKPSEDSLLLPILSVRNLFEIKRIPAMFWIDTREMLADGLTKGGVDRQLLDWACDAGCYLLKIGNHVRCTRTRIGAGAGGS